MDLKEGVTNFFLLIIAAGVIVVFLGNGRERLGGMKGEPEE